MARKKLRAQLLTWRKGKFTISKPMTANQARGSKAQAVFICAFGKVDEQDADDVWAFNECLAYSPISTIATATEIGRHAILGLSKDRS